MRCQACKVHHLRSHRPRQPRLRLLPAPHVGFNGAAAVSSRCVIAWHANLSTQGLGHIAPATRRKISARKACAHCTSHKGAESQHARPVHIAPATRAQKVHLESQSKLRRELRAAHDRARQPRVAGAQEQRPAARLLFKHAHDLPAPPRGLQDAYHLGRRAQLRALGQPAHAASTSA